MAELLDLKAVQRLKKRISEYEKLLARRRKLDRRIEMIARELAGSGISVLKPERRRRLTKAERRARSLAMKRVWTEKRKASRAKPQAKAIASPGVKQGEKGK